MTQLGYNPHQTLTKPTNKPPTPWGSQEFISAISRSAADAIQQRLHTLVSRSDGDSCPSFTGCLRLAANKRQLYHYPEISGRAHICHATFFFSLQLISCLGSLKWRDVGGLVHLQSQVYGVAMISQWVNVKLFMHFLLMGAGFLQFFLYSHQTFWLGRCHKFPQSGQCLPGSADCTGYFTTTRDRLIFERLYL